MQSADSALAVLAADVDLPPPLAQAARDLARPNPSVAPDFRNEQVLALFSADATLQNLPVLEDGRPIGLINRNVFMTSFALPFRREVFARKSCIAFMDKSPLVVDEDLSLAELCRRASADDGKALREGFIVTAQGRYLGMGLGNELLTAMADLQADRNRQVRESIDYASVIQKSFMRPSRAALAGFFGERFRLVWEPRDVVGGDCFFATPVDDGLLFLLMDCTGHGVPGALMTMIVMAFADHAAATVDASSPAEVLGTINRMVKGALDQYEHRTSPLDAGMNGHVAVEGSDDGMDAAALWISRDGRRVRFAGAHQGLLVLRAGGEALDAIDGDKHGVGYIRTPDRFGWTAHELELAPGDRLFLVSDGVIDQVGGPRRFAFGKRRLHAALLEGRVASLDDQIDHLWTRFMAWQGEERRRDDVTLFGVQA